MAETRVSTAFTQIAPALRITLLNGETAGAYSTANNIVDGIKTEDRLVSVTAFNFSLNSGGAPADNDPIDIVGPNSKTDLTNEFSITADDTIDNTNGTDLSGNFIVFVMWLDASKVTSDDAAIAP